MFHRGWLTAACVGLGCTHSPAPPPRPLAARVAPEARARADVELAADGTIRVDGVLIDGAQALVDAVYRVAQERAAADPPAVGQGHGWSGPPSVLGWRATPTHRDVPVAAEAAVPAVRLLELLHQVHDTPIVIPPVPLRFGYPPAGAMGPDEGEPLPVRLGYLGVEVGAGDGAALVRWRDGAVDRAGLGRALAAVHAERVSLLLRDHVTAGQLLAVLDELTAHGTRALWIGHGRGFLRPPAVEAVVGDAVVEGSGVPAELVRDRALIHRLGACYQQGLERTLDLPRTGTLALTFGSGATPTIALGGVGDEVAACAARGVAFPRRPTPPPPGTTVRAPVTFRIVGN